MAPTCPGRQEAHVSLPSLPLAQTAGRQSLSASSLSSPSLLTLPTLPLLRPFLGRSYRLGPSWEVVHRQLSKTRRMLALPGFCWLFPERWRGCQLLPQFFPSKNAKIWLPSQEHYCILSTKLPEKKKKKTTTPSFESSNSDTAVFLVCTLQKWNFSVKLQLLLTSSSWWMVRGVLEDSTSDLFGFSWKTWSQHLTWAQRRHGLVHLLLLVAVRCQCPTCRERQSFQKLST